MRFIRFISRAVGRLTRKQQVVLLVVLMVGITGAGFAIYQAVKPPKKTADKVTYASDRSPIAPEKLVKLPDGPSSVCKKVEAVRVQEAIGEKIEPKTVPLADGKTADGTMAGCSYIVTAAEGQKLRSVSVNIRTLKDEAAAKSLYSRLTQEEGQKINKLDNEAYFRDQVNQLITRKDTQVIVVTIGRQDTDWDIPSTVFENVAKLYL